MKRTHYMLLIAQGLSYALIVTFLFADTVYNFTGFLRNSGVPITLRSAYVSACLIGIVGTTNLWLTWYYINKSNRVSEMLVICAWTHRVKTKNGWVSLETFLTEQFGYAISHGLSTEKLKEMQAEVDRDWNKMERSKVEERKAVLEGKKPIGMLPADPQEKPAKPKTSPQKQRLSPPDACSQPTNSLSHPSHN